MSFYLCASNRGGWGGDERKEKKRKKEEIGRGVRLLEARRDRDRKKEEAGGAKLKLIKDLQYKRREEREKNSGHTVSEGRCY